MTSERRAFFAVKRWVEEGWLPLGKGSQDDGLESLRRIIAATIEEGIAEDRARLLDPKAPEA